MTCFASLYSDIILKKIVTKIKKDTELKNKATLQKLESGLDGSVRTQRHWKAAASSEFYYREMVTGYERMRDLDKLTNWSEKLNQDRYSFMTKFDEVLQTYRDYYEEVKE